MIDGSCNIQIKEFLKMNQSFNLTYKIFNRRNLPLQIRCKGGLDYELYTVWDGSNRNVSIEVRLEGVNLKKLKVDPSRALTKLDRRIMDSMKEKIGMLHDTNPYGDAALENQVVVFEVVITNQELERKNAIHSELLGFSAYLGTFDREVHAMYTPDETLSDISVENGEVGNSVNSAIVLVDPERRYSNLWTNCFGRAVKIDSVNGAGRSPGLYLFCEGEDVERIQQYFTFDELNNKILHEYGIFMSEQEALMGGNTDELIRTRKSLENVKKENREYQTIFGRQNKVIRDLEMKVTTTASEIVTLKYTLSRKDSDYKFMERLDKQKQGVDRFGNYVKNASIICSTLLSVYKTVA